MKTVKYLLQTSSILISILILLGSISFIKQDADILITINFIKWLNIKTKEISLGILKYMVVASSIEIILLSISLGFNNKVMYILTIVTSALSLNYIGVAAGIFGIILVNKQKNDPSSVVNYDLKIGGGNIALFIIQFVITLPIAIGLLYNLFINGLQLDPWLALLIIPILVVLLFYGLVLVSIEIVLLTIAGLLSKQKWVFRISMIGSFATLQIFSGIAAMRVITQNQ